MASGCKDLLPSVNDHTTAEGREVLKKEFDEVTMLWSKFLKNAENFKDQQEKLNKFKIKTRLENEHYLRKHPEVECILTGFLGEVLTNRPDNIRDFAADFFTDKELPNKLTKMLEDRQQTIRQNRVLKKL